MQQAAAVTDDRKDLVVPEDGDLGIGGCTLLHRLARANFLLLSWLFDATTWVDAAMTGSRWAAAEPRSELSGYDAHGGATVWPLTVAVVPRLVHATASAG